MRPVIGITAGSAKNQYGQATVSLPDAYVQAIIQAGGLPVVIPPAVGAEEIAGMASKFDGILFSGGGDIEPERFHAQPHPSVEGVDPARDNLELGLLQEAITDEIPFLGICRGFQVVNVGLGGTLYTHLPEQFQGALHHDNPSDKRLELVHEIQMEKESLIEGIIGQTRLEVNSHHHQGLKDLGQRLRATGLATDGLVEAIELPDHRFGLAVQWHPEWLTHTETARRLFGRFVEAAAQRQT